MQLKSLHDQNKNISTAVMFKTADTPVISLQILANQQLKEHITKTPALLVCVLGMVAYSTETGEKQMLEAGDFVRIEPNIKHWLDAETDSQLLLIK
jgi:quercetin dioxygenase-like cupin family protein